ncbi:hypothetical protein RclHR1_09050005 [Rhizophagus clarus]|uniref:Ribonuclease H-like domain-containing protein n=1 Tax=Rhizophagus clarus TaxID=94130 RepID=A0A2Z6SDL0_9GLOM|nr:hypothetical protein RclHR1_09050005 [Rhizophagus clarus]GES95946.1 ribonuclease H-like domain-containing protein [Rhizophagus clarus]
MHKYKLKLVSYNEDFKNSDKTSILWWMTIDDTESCLQDLALYILSITSHSTGCERVFLTLGWLYEKKRLYLQISKIESMAKIRSFYISKVNDELKYASSKYPKDKLKIMINESLNNLEKDLEGNKPEGKIVEQYKIPNHIGCLYKMRD